jgi:hypothetical protein
MTPITWAGLPANPAEPEPTDVIVRQSTIGSMQFCEWRVGYRETEGFLSPAVSEAMAFGTCMHYLGERHLAGDDMGKMLLNMREWVEEILVTQYDWTLDRVPDVHEFFSELGVAYRTWTQQILPEIESQEIVALEETIFLPLGETASGTRVLLQGTPDIITTPIRDMKTAGTGWKKSKAELSIQASLYMALVKQGFGLNVREFVFDVYNRRKSEWEMIPVSRRVKDIDAALRTALDYGNKIELKAFTASPVPEASFTKKRGWYCSPKYCEAWNVCDYKYLGDDVNENIVAIRSWK